MALDGTAATIGSF